jgi:hypothetical protein
LTVDSGRRNPNPYQGEVDNLNLKLEDYWMVALVVFSILFTLSLGWGLRG